MSKFRYNISAKRKRDNNMKNKINILTLFLIAIISLVGFTSCKNNTTSFDENKDIIKYSRDTTSGTRDGFFTAIGYAEAKEDDTKIPGFIRTTDNANMITLVSNDNYGIGYISLASIPSIIFGLFGMGVINPLVRGLVLALNFQKVIYSDYNVSFNGVIITMEDVTEKDKLARTKRDFFQSKSLGGTGLGLAIVKHICEIYGYKIKLDSTLDKGTTITIKFL